MEPINVPTAPLLVVQALVTSSSDCGLEGQVLSPRSAGLAQPRLSPAAEAREAVSARSTPVSRRVFFIGASKERNDKGDANNRSDADAVLEGHHHLSSRVQGQ